MPIPADRLNHDFVVLDAQTTVQQARDHLAAKGAPAFLVVKLADGRFAVTRLTELDRLLDQLRSARDKALLLNASLGDLLTPLGAIALDVSVATAWDADSKRKRAPGGCLVATSDGQIVGLLVEEAVVMRSFAGPKGPSTLTADETAQPQAEPEQRWINSELFDSGSQRHDPKQKPLQLSQLYTLVFDVDTQARSTSLIMDAFFKFKFSIGEQKASLTVRLESDDFEILTEPQKLMVPRAGKSENKARFDIRPRREGPAVVNAILLKDGNFIQLVTLKFTVVSGEMFSSESHGRPVNAAFAVQPRDVSLTILNTGAGFQVILSGPVAATATLPITLLQLDQMIAQARQQLKDIVYLQDGGLYPYQAGVQIPPAVNQAALRKLAQAGFRLYQSIFYGPNADAQANLLGDKLRQMAQRDTLKIQIFSQEFVLPWGILYMADEYDPDNIVPEHFLGLKHIIEHIPLQPSMLVTDRVIDSRNGLQVSLNVNQDIDQQMDEPLIANQSRYWEKLASKGGVNVVVRSTGAQVTQALKDTTTPDEIAYFYCHAVSKALGEQGGPDDSALVFTGGARLTLGDLSINAPARKVLPGEPLVFINACESAELSPLFYDGFVRYFMAKGARGVIGTECETPAVFAAEWARRFFDRFLAGGSLGQVFLDLRQEFFAKHHNLLGLLYALYCDGDTQVVPGLPVS
jgi:hypothetical protein